MLPQFNTIYQFYSDEVARRATSITIENDVSPSLSGGDAYGPYALVDDNPAKVAKIEATSGAWIFAYAEKQRIEIAALIHHSLDETVGSPGSPSPSIRLEGNNTSDFSSPTFVAHFVIPAWLGTGTRRWPVNPYLILTDETGYDADGFLYWRLVIEGNSQNIQLGQVWFGETIRRFDPDVRWGLKVNPDKPLIENRTGFGISTIYSRQTTLWGYEAELQATDELANALEAQWYDVDGRALPFLLVPSGPGPDDRCYLVRGRVTNQQRQWDFDDVQQIHLAFEEVGRGLRPGT